MKSILFLIMNLCVHFFSADLACMDQKIEDLEQIYSDYIIFVQNYDEVIYRMNSPRLYSDLQRSKEKKTINDKVYYDSLFSNSQCNSEERNKTKINEQSVCPWESVVIQRLDRYPFHREVALCTCGTCSSEIDEFPNSLFSCMPISKTLPVLIKKKNKCDSEGYAVWEKKFEKINVACVCGLRNKHYSHGLK